MIWQGAFRPPAAELAVDASRSTMKGIDVMSRLTDRRAILFAAGTAALVAATGAVAAQAADIRGVVAFEGGTAIPEGRIEVYLDAPATGSATGSVAGSAAGGGARVQASKARLASDGGMKSVEFSLPAGATVSQPQQVVAQLLREDGWLLARGSAEVKDGATVEITLYTVMY